MKYNVKINKWNSTEDDELNCLYFISVIDNNNHNFRKGYYESFINNEITKLTKNAYRKLCVNPIIKHKEIWFKNWKDADKTKSILESIINNKN